MEEKKYSQRILLLLGAHSLHSLFTGPPKALDDDETDFLDQWETVRSYFHVVNASCTCVETHQLHQVSIVTCVQVEILM